MVLSGGQIGVIRDLGKELQECSVEMDSTNGDNETKDVQVRKSLTYFYTLKTYFS